MTKRFLLYTQFIAVIFFVGCRENKTNDCKSSVRDSIKELSHESFEKQIFPLGILNVTDTLKILIEASDYGEWGGHREYIYLQRNIKKEIIARFIMDSVPFIIINKNGTGVLDENKRKIIINKTKVLSCEDEELVSLFITRLIELYLENKGCSNAGTVYEVINTNSSLKFSFWNNCGQDTYYGKVRKQIFSEFLNSKN
jgi:hypothetical protein